MTDDRQPLDRKHLGSRSELVACIWLLDEGYEVFRNISAHGEADIVAFKDGKSHLFDVKSSTYTKNEEHGQRLSQKQIDRGVLKISVYPDGKCRIMWNPTPSLTNVEATCPVCSQPFRKRRNIQMFCTAYCRDMTRPRCAEKRKRIFG